MNYIGIDISLNSTAIYIENEQHMKILSITNKDKNNKYIKDLSLCGVDFHFMNKENTLDYSDNEILKLKHYDSISDEIINKIKKNIIESEKTYCLCEGYSFSKNTSSILDIVSLSTMIKIKIIKNIKDVDLSIIAPTSLKLETCKLVYKPVDVGKRKPKLVYKNYDGVAGGSFKKHEMFKSILDGDISSPITNYLKENIDILNLKKIPNPIEDIIDSIFACKIKRNQLKNDL